MSKKNIAFAAIAGILTVVFLVLTIKSGGTDLGYPPMTFIFGFLTFRNVRKLLDEKKGMTREKKLPPVATGGLVLIVSVALVVIGVFFGAAVCGADGCDNKVVDGYSYCEEHKCTTDNCNEAKLKSFDYCDLCKCDQKDCNETGSGNKYCEKHECSDWLCEKIRVEGKEFCADHVDCYFEGCSKEKISGFEYCIDHKCAVPDCKYGINSNLKYCSTHGCSYDGCSSLKANEGNSCSIHKCSTSGCANAKEEGKALCRNCISKAEREAEYRKENAEYLDKIVVNTGEKQIWKIYVKDGYFKMKAEYRGDGNFIVEINDSNQDHVDLLCNEIGDYILDKTIYLPEGYYYLEIRCSRGSWSGKWYGTYGR